ncbi:hypothetical protein F4604DRAFT_1933942 [Suillus subluteus]|nr:hypothetical protein F4604DRAFT_1933942 [Suillus subluteus]
MALSLGLKANHTMMCLDVNIPPDDEEFTNPASNGGLGKGVWNMIQESELAKSIRQGGGLKHNAEILSRVYFGYVLWRIFLTVVAPVDQDLVQQAKATVDDITEKLESLALHILSHDLTAGAQVPISSHFRPNSTPNRRPAPLRIINRSQNHMSLEPPFTHPSSLLSAQEQGTTAAVFAHCEHIHSTKVQKSTSWFDDEESVYSQPSFVPANIHPISPSVPETLANEMDVLCKRRF